MKLSKFIESNIKKKEPILVKSLRSILLILYFIISIYLSYDNNDFLFVLSVSGMTIYAIVIVWSLFSRRPNVKY